MSGGGASRGSTDPRRMTQLRAACSRSASCMLSASSSSVLAPRPDGRTRRGRSSLTHGPRDGTKPAAAGKASKTVPHTKPGHTQHVTGLTHHALLTEGSPMGSHSVPGHSTEPVATIA
jgi:hypothetical protein